MKSRRAFLISIIAMLNIALLSFSAVADPTPIWECSLDNDGSITVDGGSIVSGPSSYVSGVYGKAFAGNGSVYANWGNTDVENIFGSWNDSLGSTVDLYFRGDHWDTHSGDSGFWSVTDRYDGPDGYIMLSVRDGSLRFPMKDSYTGYGNNPHLTGVSLANNVTYRLTMRQQGTNFEVYLDGGAYSNDTPVYTTSFSQTISFPEYNSGSPGRDMSVANRAIFGGILQGGEWVDNIRVYNGYYTPTELGIPSGYSMGDLNGDNIVDFKDVKIIADNWLVSGLTVSEGNLDESGPVNFHDYCLLAEDWLFGALVLIIHQPENVSVSEGQTATLTMQAEGSTPITYQWQKDSNDLSDGGRISGATTDTLQISDVNKAADEGVYRCVVENNYGSVISDGATLTVTTSLNIGTSSSGHYVTYKGDTLMVVGDSGTQCATQNSNLDHREWIDDCNERGIRAIHVWAFVPARQKQDGSVIEDRWGYVYPDVVPWARKTSGTLALDQRYQWDLTQFDEGAVGDCNHYWPRMRDMASYAKSKNILLGVTMFTGWTKHDPPWSYHPLHVNNGGHLINNGDAVIIDTPGTEVWQETYSGAWSNAKKTQWVWERYSIKMINDLGSLGNVFFVFFDEHSYSEGNMGDHFRDFFRNRGQFWVDWNARRSTVDAVFEPLTSDDDKNADTIAEYNKSPALPFLMLERGPYMGDGVRESIWTMAIGGGYYFFHGDEDQETVRTGIMGYDPYVPSGDKGMYKRDWLGYASRFFNEYVTDFDSLIPANALSSTGSYCLADNGTEYAVYSKDGYSSITMNLSAASGKTLDCRFYDPENGTFNSTFQRSGGSSSEVFIKPNSYDWILHIVEQ